MLHTLETPGPESFSPRQNAVLEEALRLLVSGGEKALTTAGVARAANCSKESLYKWFGDRNGLPVSQVGRRLRVPRSALEKVLDRPGRLYTASAPDDGGGGTDVGAKWPGTWTSDATFSAASPSIDGVTCE